MNLLFCPVLPVQLKGQAFVLLADSSAPFFACTHYFGLPFKVPSPFIL